MKSTQAPAPKGPGAFVIQGGPPWTYGAREGPASPTPRSSLDFELSSTPLIVEHWFYRGASAPARIIFDDFEELRENAALEGSTIQVTCAIIADIMGVDGKREGSFPTKRPVGRPRGNRVQHVRRESLSERHPVHVTLRFLPHVYGLRSRRSFRRIETALREFRKAHDARVVHYAVLGNHIHLIVEATDRTRLTRRIQGFEVRVARSLNKMMDRRGKVFSDRYHAHVLRTPREAHHAIGYVLRNAAKHFGGRRTTIVDPYSSASTFAGWSEPIRLAWSPITPGEPLTSDPKSWLLRVAWAQLGRMDPTEAPGSRG